MATSIINQQSTAIVNAYDGPAVGSALNGATIDGTASYTRCRRKAGWVFMKIRIRFPTISSDRTAVLSLVDDLRPVADIPYVWARNEWNQSIQGQCTISADGKVYAMANCSEKDLTIWAVYPGL